MLFQSIDDKSECVGIYVEGKMLFDGYPGELSRTWKYAGSHPDGVQYAWLYANGGTLQEMCPENLREQLDSITKKFTAYHKSFKIAKVNLNEHCIFDLIPIDFLTELCETKSQICEHVFENFKKPKNYEHLLAVEKLLYKIRYQKLNLNTEGCKELLYATSQREMAKKLCSKNSTINYNLYGTVTGRLATSYNSFPILTMKREYRKLMKPMNDLFISLDYNGAEIRTLLQLSGIEQPQEDIHIWNSRHLFEQEIDRDEAKVRFFAWLYDPQSEDIETKLYDKKSLLDKWYKDGYIKTPYQRKIKVEQRKAFNYLIQSTTADRVLEKAVKIDKMMENRKSYISHIMHDEIVIDYNDEDRDIIQSVKEVFEDGFLSNVKGGKSYFDLEVMEL
jgi:hypothetical protein